MFSARHGLFTWTPRLPARRVVGWVLLAAPRRLAAGAVLPRPSALAVLVNGAHAGLVGLGVVRPAAPARPDAAVRDRPGRAARVPAPARPLVLPAARAGAPLVAWNLQFAYIFNSEMLATAHAGRQPRPPGGRAGGSALPHAAALGAVAAAARCSCCSTTTSRASGSTRGRGRCEGRVDLGGEPPDELAAVVGHNWYRPEREGDVGLPPLARAEVLAARAHPHARATSTRCCARGRRSRRASRCA